MASQPTRRDVLKASAAGALGFGVFGAALAAPRTWKNSRLQFACIGIGGKGESDTADAARFGHIVAICDADRRRLAEGQTKYPDARPFTDFRYMFRHLADQIDAVTVSTPDHTHAAATAMALRLKKHAFCQKPLTRTLFEARSLAQLARENGLATQMGNQGTAAPELRRAAAAIRTGAIGRVREVHVWTDRALGWWPQGVSKPEPTVKPDFVDWDAWLGPAPVRHWADAYHPFRWRGWWDFGTGALGDMGCHVMNLPFMALDLRDPLAVRAETSGHNRNSFPAWSIVHYEFGPRESRPALSLVWYDGGKKPPQELAPNVSYSAGGVLIVGENDTLYVPGEHGGGARFLKGALPEVEFERSPGHFEEWIYAIQGGPPAKSNFPDYASPLTETVLLGNLAVWATGERLEWDARNLSVRGRRDLDALIRPSYRQGWDL